MLYELAVWAPCYKEEKNMKIFYEKRFNIYIKCFVNLFNFFNKEKFYADSK